MVYGMVLGGGIGQRMGSDIPKQFLKVNGRALISYTVKVFVDSPDIDKVLVLVPEDWLDYTKELFFQDLGKVEKLEVIAGGELRNDTIMNGIAHIKAQDGFDENTALITHDAVRPFVTQEIIAANVEALKTHTACDTVIPATDTIVESLDHTVISSVPDRAYLYQGQTPQSFRLGKFEELYDSLTDEEKKILTDAAKVFVLKGEDVALVEGASSNIKITYPSDIDLAKSLLGRR